MIGVFSIPIGDLMMSLISERKEETEKMEELLGKLDELIKQDLALSIKLQGPDIKPT